MSEKEVKKSRKHIRLVTTAEQLRIASESAPAVAKLVSDTNLVIKEMQANWSMADKVQFCMWFLGVATPEQMAAEMGLVMVDEVSNDAQHEFDFEGDRDATDDTKTEGDTSETGAEE